MLLSNLLEGISSFDIQHIFYHAHLLYSFFFFLFLLNFELFLFFFQCRLLNLSVLVIRHLLICYHCLVWFLTSISLLVHLISCLQEDQSFIAVAVL